MRKIGMVLFLAVVVLAALWFLSDPEGERLANLTGQAARLKSEFGAWTSEVCDCLPRAWVWTHAKIAALLASGADLWARLG